MSSLKKRITARDRIARNLRNLRLQRKMSQEELASGADITQSFLSQVESAKRNVSIDTIERLADVLNVDVLDILAHVQIRE